MLLSDTPQGFAVAASTLCTFPPDILAELVREQPLPRFIEMWWNIGVGWSSTVRCIYVRCVTLLKRAVRVLCCLSLATAVPRGAGLHHLSGWGDRFPETARGKVLRKAHLHYSLKPSLYCLMKRHSGPWRTQHWCIHAIVTTAALDLCWREEGDGGC
jgi:hypothetical protein